MDKATEVSENLEMLKALFDVLRETGDTPLSDHTVSNVAYNGYKLVEDTEQKWADFHQSTVRARRTPEESEQPETMKAVEVAQLYDTLDDDQKDLVRRVMREFPV